MACSWSVLGVFLGVFSLFLGCSACSWGVQPVLGVFSLFLGVFSLFLGCSACSWGVQPVLGVFAFLETTVGGQRSTTRTKSSL